MELKTKYQYSYFIYPYIIDEKSYDKYLLRLLRDRHCSLRMWEKERDLNVYTYFLPAVRDYMFWSFGFDRHKKKAFDKLDKEMKANFLAKQNCTMFEYALAEDVQGKMGEENGIFFEIPKIQIICFKTGVCFIVIKTIVDEGSNLSDILNFNYKFRDINSEYVSLKNYDNIRLQTNKLKDIKELSTVIKNIAGTNTNLKEMNIDEERFFTYSYVCLEQEHWQEEEDFANLQEEFIKFSSILPSAHQLNYSEERYRKQVLQPLKFTKMGFTKQGTVLLASSKYPENYLQLPFSYEQEYLYTYILALYKKIYLNKMNIEFSKTKNFTKIRNKLLDFTRSIWIHEVTADDEGTRLYEKWKDTLEMDKLYSEIKNKYDIEYKDLNFDQTTKVNYIMVAILTGTLLFTVVNFAMMIMRR